MRFAGFTLALAGIFAGSALGQTPTVTGLLNNYSNTLPGLPNYGIAEGSIFDIYGTNLSSTTTSLQGPPLKTSLDGVSISVTVNGTVTSPLIYFLSSGQIDAVLPSATPAGTGTITVTNSGGTSAAFPITVVTSAFGLLTTNNGSGPAQGYDANINPKNQYTLFGYSEAANPGDILELWGTGLGPTANDATGVVVTPTAQVLIGGVAANVLYAGRSGFTGLDQINVRVPAGLSGCSVSVAVVTGSGATSNVSNFATVAVAASGRTCTDPTNPLTSAILSEITQTGSLSIGVVSVTSTTTQGILGIGGGTTDSGSAAFLKFTAAEFNSGALAAAAKTASIGSCSVFTYSATSTSGAPPQPFQFTFLNAGPDVNINGPDGLIAMPLQTIQSGGNTINIYDTPTADTSFIPAAGGTFTFDNGAGGPDVGAFTVSLQMTSPLVWSNMGSISTVTRSNGQLVSWTGGDPSSYVSITGVSFGSVNGSATDFVVGSFTCQAATSAGSFTVPSSVLLALPASTTVAGISFSSMSVSNVTGPVTFTAQGLDLGLAEAQVENTITVTYQ